MSSAVVLLPTQTNDRRCIRQEKTKRCAVNKECSSKSELRYTCDTKEVYVLLVFEATNTDVSFLYCFQFST